MIRHMEENNGMRKRRENDEEERVGGIEALIEREGKEGGSNR